MLRHLNVQNFALIENAELSFDEGFSVITGETGSGKSILLGALRLILGERADFGVIRNQAQKTVVEAAFNLEKTALNAWFTHVDLDYATETIIRREINAQGKSRAFINDTPVQLSVLKELTEQLIHIHSQHHTLDLKNKSFQLDLIDALSDAQDLKKACAGIFSKWQLAKNRLRVLKDEFAAAEREYDFNAFLLEELKALQLEKVNFEVLEEDVNRGEQAEDILRGFSAISEVINDENGVNTLLTRLSKLNDFGDKQLKDLVERINSLRIELDDIAATADDCSAEISISPEELAQKVKQLDDFNSALRKHHVHSQGELVKVLQTLSEKVKVLDDSSEELSFLESEVAQYEENYLKVAKELSQHRKTHSAKISQMITEWLRRLKLEQAVVEVVFSESVPSVNGIDQCTLLFSANKGMTAQPVDKVASGGELSRLMLVIQYLLSGKRTLPTVIFDEIDTGVSGEVAQRIGELMQLMGESMQLMAITHLPQVAAKGAHHFKVTKRENNNNETITEIQVLNKQECVTEVARLMSGSEINKSALETAKNLMQ